MKKSKFNKLSLVPEKRLKSIKSLALCIQDIKRKSLKEIRTIAESIEILADTKLLKKLNQGIDDVNKGRTHSFEEMMIRIKKKRAVSIGSVEK